MLKTRTDVRVYFILGMVVYFNWMISQGEFVMTEQEIVLGDDKINVCQKLIQMGKKRSGYTLSYFSEAHLEYMLQCTLRDRSLTQEPVALMYGRAVLKSGRSKVIELDRVGNISLARAGFSFLVSRYFKRSIENTTEYFTSFGKSCFYTAGRACEAVDIESGIYFQLVEEFDALVGVLKAAQAENCIRN